MLKFSAGLLSLAAGALMLAGSAAASPITYNLTLTATPGTFSTVLLGSGSFTIDGNDFTGTGNEYFLLTDPAKTLEDISFNIDGHIFDKTEANAGYAQVFFQNGALAGITYTGQDGNVLISLNAGALSYIYNNYDAPYPFPYSNGVISGVRVADTDQVGAVPEPATLALLGTGLFAMGKRFRRKA